MATEQIVTDTYQPDFPLKDLVESPSNPREEYDPVKMRELVESTKSHGIIQALVGRKREGNKVEIVCGSRRFRAAKEAGLNAVPIRIRELSDQAVLEIQLIENAMREDVHPLHEGLAYARLLKFKDYTVEVIAQKTGHEAKLVRQRLALSELIDAPRKMFLSGEINIGHANLFARLPANKQKEALPLLEDSRWSPVLGKHEKVVVTVKELDTRIRERLLLDLHASPWKKDDEKLFPEAGACLKCTKRSGANAFLFEDLSKKELCFDGKCYEKKGELFLVQIEATAKQENRSIVRISARYNVKDALNEDQYQKVGKVTCSHTEEGLFVDGPDKGTIVKICRAKGKCATHWKHSFGSSTTPKDYWQTRAEGLERTIKIKVAQAQVKAVIEHGPKYDSSAKLWQIPHAMMRVIGRALCGYSEAPELAPALGLEKVKNGHDLAGQLEKILDAPAGSPDGMRAGMVLYGLALSGAAKEYAQGDDLKLLADSCVALKVDAKKISTEIGTSLRTEFNTKRKKAQAKKKEAAAKDAPKVKAKPAAKKKAKR